MNWNRNCLNCPSGPNCPSGCTVERPFRKLHQQGGRPRADRLDGGGPRPASPDPCGSFCLACGRCAAPCAWRCDCAKFPRRWRHPRLRAPWKMQTWRAAFRRSLNGCLTDDSRTSATAVTCFGASVSSWKPTRIDRWRRILPSKTIRSRCWSRKFGVWQLC